MQDKVSEPQLVQVVGIRMGFGEMVVFLVKLAIAAIPAAIILTILWVLLAAVVNALLRHLS